MATVFDVAKYILEEMGEMSTWKLQKLCYYSQAWELAWTSQPLFEEDFQAWRNGPVCRELFDVHKGMYYITADELNKGDSNNLLPREKEDIDIVLKDYGNMEPYELREQTHLEDPWINARHGMPEGMNSEEIIEKEDIGNYYASL